MPGRFVETRAKPPSKWRRRVVLALAAVCLWLAWEWFTLPDVSALVKTTPTASALMRRRLSEAEDEGKKLSLEFKPVPLSRVSMHVQKCVVLAEDARFWLHDGVDWIETRKAVSDAVEAGKLGRGASTITQQLAKNLFLSDSRSLLRKVKEWVLASRLEDELTKKRILELYLTFAEWGDGVFGIDAAARRHFGKPASELDAGEAAVLVAMLPSPRTRDPKKPNTNLVRRAHRLAKLMEEYKVAKNVDARVTQLVGAAKKKAPVANE